MEGLQKHIRKVPSLLHNFSVQFFSSDSHIILLQGVQLAKYFESLVRDDERFEIPAERHLGLVVFRMKV